MMLATDIDRAFLETVCAAGEVAAAQALEAAAPVTSQAYPLAVIHFAFVSALIKMRELLATRAPEGEDVVVPEAIGLALIQFIGRLAS